MTPCAYHLHDVAIHESQKDGPDKAVSEGRHCRILKRDPYTLLIIPLYIFRVPNGTPILTSLQAPCGGRMRLSGMKRVFTCETCTHGFLTVEIPWRPQACKGDDGGPYQIGLYRFSHEQLPPVCASNLDGRTHAATLVALSTTTRGLLASMCCPRMSACGLY